MSNCGATFKKTRLYQTPQDRDGTSNQCPKIFQVRCSRQPMNVSDRGSLSQGPASRICWVFWSDRGEEDLMSLGGHNFAEIPPNTGDALGKVLP